MATEILPIGTDEAVSAPLVVDAAGLTVCLKDGSGPNISRKARVDIQLEDDAGNFMTIATLTDRQLALVIQSPGTYRFMRIAGTACGVFSV